MGFKNFINRVGDKFRETFDIPDVNESVRSDWRDVKDYYLSHFQKERLARMGFFKRNFFERFWLLEIMFNMLNDYKRIILVITIISMFMTVSFNTGEESTINFHFGIIAVLGLLYLLMVEIKEKLLAKDELQSGRKVQLSMTPSGNQNIKGWDIWLFSDPAKEVGGDLLDIYSLDNEEYYLATGDVSGKGLAAALFMVKLRSTIRSLTGIIDDPKQLIGKVNEIFRRDKTRSMFSSLVLIEFHASDGNVEIINAGHMPPIIVQNNDTIELSRTCPAIGIMDNVICKSDHVDIDQNDTILIYSDGITEAKDEFGNFFGKPRLKKILEDGKKMPIEMIGMKILDALKRFRGEAPVYDDYTLAIMRKK